MILHRPTFTGLAAVLITWLPVDWENWWKFNGISTVINMWMEYLLTTQNGWFHGYVDHLDYKSWVPPKKLEFDEFGSKLWTRPLGFLRFPPNFGFSPVESKQNKTTSYPHHSYHLLSITRARNGDILGFSLWWNLSFCFKSVRTW